MALVSLEQALAARGGAQMPEAPGGEGRMEAQGRGRWVGRTVEPAGAPREGRTGSLPCAARSLPAGRPASEVPRGPSLQPELTRGDTSTEVGTVATGVRGPKLLGTRRPRPAIRSQPGNILRSGKVRVRPPGPTRRSQRGLLGSSAPAGQAERPPPLSTSVFPSEESTLDAPRLGERTHLAATALVPSV